MTPEGEDHEVLLHEVRRAGRAAVAAQAAAETCEELMEQAQARPARATEPALDPATERLLRAILPVRDALDRMAQGARRAPEARPRGFRGLFRRGDDAATQALRDAVLLLDQQLEGALESCGVELDRAVGVPVDPDRHRVVETVTAAGMAPGQVERVLRSGCRSAGVQVREADVSATK